MDERQRSVLADKAPDMANLVAAALIVGFALEEPAASGPLVATALVVWVTVLAAAVVLSRK